MHGYTKHTFKIQAAEEEKVNLPYLAKIHHIDTKWAQCLPDRRAGFCIPARDS